MTIGTTNVTTVMVDSGGVHVIHIFGCGTSEFTSATCVLPLLYMGLSSVKLR